MLVELHLRNVGVIAEASVELGPGLNVVTGETGVGKTLLVTSVALLTGGRGHARLVGAGADEATVEAVVEPPPALHARLKELGVDPGEQLIWVRRLGPNGRSRAWIGGGLVPLSVLAELGEMLVELHGQGTSFALARPAAQLEALDVLASTEELRGLFSDRLARLRAVAGEQEQLDVDERSRLQEIDLLTHQVEEIRRASIASDEEAHLGTELSRLEHADALRLAGAEVGELVGADGAAGRLEQAHKVLERACVLDPSLAALTSRLGALAAESAEVSHETRTWAEELDGDPQRLEVIRERIALLNALKRKYGPTLEEVVAAAQRAQARLDELQGADRRLEEIAAELNATRTELDVMAAELHRRRVRAAKELTKLVRAELPTLALQQATFDVDCERRGEFNETGDDRVAFRFSATRSRPGDLIGKVASGGELSRVMIAVTLALARAHTVPVLVFDEADQGVGGEAALELARRLARLGQTHQVLVVTHLPQIAAFADRHIAVRRSRHAVEVEPLDSNGRVAEISRMLAGLDGSELARAHAGELLELARTERESQPAGV